MQKGNIRGWMLRVLLGVGLITVFAGAAAAGGYHVGVTVIVSHPALDGVQRGFEQALKDAGLTVTYDYQNAQGDMSTAHTIAQKFEQDGSIDLVHAIATPTAQAACKVIKKKPVVFDAVTDPVGAGLVKSFTASGGNVTGLSDQWDIDLQIGTYMDVVPDVKTWGTIYNAGDANSVKSISLTRATMEKRNLKLVEVTVSNSSEVFTAAQSLAGRVDAIYISSDNIAVSAFEAITRVANQHKIPLFAGDTGSVPRGAVMALGYNYYKTGYGAGELAVQILRDGKKPGDIDSIRVADIPDILELHLSLGNAKAQGVDLPADLVEKARTSGGKVFE
jgi:putative tryptophan/tyrosine transport system substrate-binding protein